MLKIRMQRTGRINMPSFRVIVTEQARSAKTGNFVEKVGTYNPKTKERKLEVERIKYWLSVGAQASGTVHNMLISMGVIEGKKINVLPKKSPPKPAAAESSGEVKKEPAVADLPAEASAQAGGSGEANEVAAEAAAPATPEAEKAPEVPAETAPEAAPSEANTESGETEKAAA